MKTDSRREFSMAELDEVQKWKLKKIITANFIKNGKNYTKARDAIFLQTSRTLIIKDYNNFLSSVMRHTFRALQNFIEGNINNTVKAINKKQDSKLRTPIVNCTEWMDERNLETFHKFMKITLLEEKHELIKNDVLKLYESIYQYVENPKKWRGQYNEKKKKRKANELTKIKKEIWKGQKQDEQLVDKKQQE